MKEKIKKTLERFIDFVKGCAAGASYALKS